MKYALVVVLLICVIFIAQTHADNIRDANDKMCAKNDSTLNSYISILQEEITLLNKKVDTSIARNKRRYLELKK